MLTRRLILTNSNPQQGLEYLLIQLHNTITMKNEIILVRWYMVITSWISKHTNELVNQLMSR